MPINLPTNAHGQGYTDLNLLIPETISGLEVRKGPYWADVGDFANAGDLHISLRDSIDQNIQSVTTWQLRVRELSRPWFDQGRGTARCSMPANSIPIMVRGTTAEDVRKFSGLLRYSQGTRDGRLFGHRDGLYQQLELQPIRSRCARSRRDRSVCSARLDPTDGGDTSRFMLSARMAQSDDDGLWKANAYIVKYTMNLFNNFTWDTTDPVNGDQFHQHDDRFYGGVGASRTFNGTLLNRPTETVFGAANPLRRHQCRPEQYVPAPVPVQHPRSIMSTRATSASMPRTRLHWTDWLRTTAGWRGDYFAASVNSMLQPANSGNPRRRDRQPKIHHACSARSTKPNCFSAPAWAITATTRARVTATEVPGDPTTPEGASPFLVRSAGAEIGVRTKVVPGLDSSVSLFYLHQDSELFFDGDTGDDRARPAQPAHRHRDHKQLPPGLLGARRCRPGAIACPVYRLRYCARAALPIACRLSAGADRQCAGQFQSTTRRGWWHRLASRSAKRPAGSVRCAGAISARGRSPRMASSSRRR